MNYASLKAAIQAVIKQNGNEEITGDLLQQSLLAMINALGVGYQFVGVATPETNPTIGDEKIMYIAVDSGTYSNFVTPAVTLDGSKIAIFLYSTSWSATLLNVPNNQYIATELNRKVDKVAGKGLSTNDYTDADKLRVQNALLVSDIVDSLGGGTTKVISQAAMTAILLNYARIDGYYSSLIAGAAENLVGRGSVPALFTFRPTGGNADVGSGTAQIKKLYGNSIVWNQLIPIKSSDASITQNNVTITDNRDGSYTIQTTAEGASARTTLNIIQFAAGLLTGHKVAILGISGGNVGNSYSIRDAQSGAVNTGDADVRTINSNDTVFVGISVASGAIITTPVTVRPQLVDLTLEFGQGNEPATVEEFEALYYLPYYAHNPGAIKNTTAIGIKTIGFNQWDEEWEVGTYDFDTGAKVDSSTQIRSKNYTPVFPSTNYCFTNKSARISQIFWYDANKNFIGMVANSSDSIFITTSPTNARFMNFLCPSVYGTTYNNDVCINLSWSGYRNGEYEPYWERTINMPLTTMTGKLNGEGESVVIAPDGWMSAGDARFVGIIENGMLTKVEKHVKRVDLGTLEWTYYSGGYFAGSGVESLLKKPSSNNNLPNGMSAKYLILPANSVINGEENSLSWGVGGTIVVRDSAYTDAATFKTAMNGVELNYELATPEVYVLDEPINMNYSEDDFGTEERLPADTADNVSAPIFFDVQYPMNAVDMLRRLGVNYIKKESMDHILQAFVNAGIIGSYSLTYNATNDDYDCAVTEPSVEP